MHPAPSTRAIIPALFTDRQPTFAFHLATIEEAVKPRHRQRPRTHSITKTAVRTHLNDIHDVQDHSHVLDGSQRPRQTQKHNTLPAISVNRCTARRIFDLFFAFLFFDTRSTLSTPSVREPGSLDSPEDQRPCEFPGTIQLPEDGRSRLGLGVLEVRPEKGRPIHDSPRSVQHLSFCHPGP